MDFQAQRFEQLPCEFLGELVELDAGDGQGVDQVGVGSGVDACFGGIELGFEFLAVGAEFRAALVDVAQQVGVGVVDEFEAADGALDPLVGFGDGAAQRGDVVVVVAPSVGVDGGGCGVEQGAAVGAEDVVGQEVVEAVDQLVFADEERPAGRVSFGGVVDQSQIGNTPIANWLTANQARYGLAYLIWQGQYWSAHDPRWVPYTSSNYGCPNPANLTGCHYDHIHWSIAP